MPYHWSEETPEARTLTLWPYQSLSQRCFVIFIASTCAMIAVPLLAVVGTAALWGILPFTILAIGGIWIALRKSARDGHITEILTFTTDQLFLKRITPNDHVQEWSANPYWVKAQLHPTGGPVPQYLTLKGGTREVELGAFLTEDERKTLFIEINTILRAKAYSPRS